jgi:DNA-binding MarR family transcriptional regulator
MVWGDKPLVIYAKIFEALGQESRLEVFNLICQSGKKGIRPKDIIERLGIDGGTLHFHLNRLMAVNLIATKPNERRGTYYLHESAPKGIVRIVY